jgi:hypothetical protein
MRATVRNYRQGMVDLAEEAVSDHFDLDDDTEYDSVSDYVMEVVDQTGIDNQWAIDERELDLARPQEV